MALVNFDRSSGFGPWFTPYPSPVLVARLVGRTRQGLIPVRHVKRTASISITKLREARWHFSMYHPLPHYCI